MWVGPAIPKASKPSQQLCGRGFYGDDGRRRDKKAGEHVSAQSERVWRWRCLIALVTLAHGRDRGCPMRLHHKGISLKKTDITSRLQQPQRPCHQACRPKPARQPHRRRAAALGRRRRARRRRRRRARTGRRPVRKRREVRVRRQRHVGHRHARRVLAAVLAARRPRAGHEADRRTLPPPSVPCPAAADKLTWYRMPSGESATIWMTPLLPANVAGAGTCG
jgi:hypothetical protein